MSDLDTKVRQVRALLATTVERGAFPAEAETARRLARRLIKQHGLEAHFNGHPRDRGFVSEAVENIRRAAREDVDPVQAAAERFWQAMREAGASEDALRRERARWERKRPSKARRPTEENFEHAKEEWERARAEFDEPPKHANCRCHHAKARHKAARATEYKDVDGTTRAVASMGGVVTAQALAAWFGGITEDAAHGRLWRAQMAGLLKKVPGGFVAA